MSGASIWIVTPPGYVHSGAFEEFALALSEGLRELGVAAPIVHRRQLGSERGCAADPLASSACQCANARFATSPGPQPPTDGQKHGPLRGGQARRRDFEKFFLPTSITSQ